MAKEAILVATTNITREPGNLYFVGKDGNVYKSKMNRNGRSKKAE